MYNEQKTSGVIAADDGIASLVSPAGVNHFQEWIEEGLRRLLEGHVMLAQVVLGLVAVGDKTNAVLHEFDVHAKSLARRIDTINTQREFGGWEWARCTTCRASTRPSRGTRCVPTWLPGYLAMEAAAYAPLIYLTALLNLLNQDSIKNMNSKTIIIKNTK